MISDGEIGKLTCMEFNDIFCANFWQINWNPPFCEHFIHNYQVFIQPQHCDIEIHKHHVNGGVYYRFFVFHQDNALVQRYLFRKHQPFQSAHETFTKLNLDFYGRQSLINLFLLGMGFGKVVGILRHKAINEVPFGFGDVVFGTILGLLCGWPAIAAGLLLGILLFSAYSVLWLITLVITKRYKSFTNAQALTPFLILGSIILFYLP